jgi:endonuclease YncB( thermonuclease family)
VPIRTWREETRICTREYAIARVQGIVYVRRAVGTGRFARLALRAAAVACGVALALAARPQDGPPVTGVVTAVLDGDTIMLQLADGPAVVRLAHIDAPEARQPGGPEARQALQGRVIGEKVSLQVVSRKPDEWLVAVVWLGDENVNGWMVKQGQAWAYRQYADDPDYCVWENAARSLKRGLWAREEWLAPWEWRQGGKGKAMRYTDYRKADASSCIAEMKHRT